MRLVPKTGSYPKGFSVGGIHCGVKKTNGLDLAILRNTFPGNANAAAVFTTNKFKAAPVLVSKNLLDRTNGHNINLIVVNLGNANAVTGTKGMEDARAMAAAASQACARDNSLVMSTGVIGNLLPIDKITGAMPALAKSLGSSHQHWLDCASAIMTTDTFPKLASTCFEVNGQSYSVAGVAKGAGMICPNMATMLSFMATDMPISSAALRQILVYAADRSFNSISVDGDMLTNDTVAAIANGAGGGLEITPECSAFPLVRDRITEFAQNLAQLVVRDGEGATKFITITVRNALTYADARTIARTVANLPLVKTAMFGEDANWGRILCAIGYAPVSGVRPESTLVSFIPSNGLAPLPVLMAGEPVPVDEARAKQVLQLPEINVDIDLGVGLHVAQCWTCDLTHEYISINGDYRS